MFNVGFCVDISGYANEVGEALRPVIHKKLVHLSYGVAIAYVIGDCIDKSVKTYQVSAMRMFILNECECSFEFVFFFLQRAELLGGHKISTAAKTAADVFIWQMLASVIIPGFVINRITWGTGLISKRSQLPGIARKWLPTCIGLAAIPFIIKPIDTGVDHAMDRTYRKYIN